MEISEIKTRLTILAVLSHYKLSPNKNGLIRCPFHEDDKPSLQIYPKTNTWHRFGCGKTGDQIQWIEDYDTKDKHKAIIKAAEMAGISEYKPTPLIINLKTMNEKNENIGRIAVLTKLMAEARQSLERSERTLGYCKQRGIDHTKIEVGFLGDRFYASWNEKLKQSAIEIGLLKENTNNSLSPVFRNCIIFPMRNQQGQIISIYGRSIYDNKESRHFYLKGKHLGIYPKYPDTVTKKLVICESIIDTATLLQIEAIAKEYSILSLYGTNGFTEEQTEAIRQVQELEEVIFFLNGDKAGRTAVLKHTATISALKPGIKITNIEPPEGEDVNSLAVGHKPSIFTHLLENRTFLFSLEKSDEKEKPVSTAKSGIQEVQPSSVRVTPRFITADKLNTTNPYKIAYTTPTANYYIKGGLRKELDSMKVSIDIENKETKLKKRERLDLYIDKLVEKLAREAAEKLNLRADLVEADLNKLTDLLDAYREQVLLLEDESETAQKKKEVKVPLNIAERCIHFLQQSSLMKQFLQKIREAGLVGEDRNCLLVFCIGSSSRMPKTLHGIIQGNTGKGKTYLMHTICSMMPPEYYIPLTTLSDKSLFNNGKYDIQFHLIAIEDRDSMTDEVRLYFRELISKEEISRHVTRADKEGNYKTIFQLVLGPMASLSCTTNGELFPDDANRCFLISVDESPEQIQRIIEQRNKRAAGLIDEKKEKNANEFIQNCIRMLKPCNVVNPYATQIHLPDKCKDINRLHELFIRLINQITLLHQYQCKKDEQSRLITKLEYIEFAVHIMFDAIVLKADDLNEKQRKFFENLKSHIQGIGGDNYREYKFKQREIRMSLNLCATSVKNYLKEMVEMEYIEIVYHNENKGNIYKISYWDDCEKQREEIKQYLRNQINEIKKRESGQNEVSTQQ